MPTTLTLDEEVAQLVREVPRTQRRPFAQVANEALRTGLKQLPRPWHATRCRYSLLAVLGTLLSLLCAAARAEVATEALAGFEGRRAACLRHAVDSPFPKLGTTWGDLTYAVAALYLNEHVAEANARLAALKARNEKLDHWRLQQGHRLLLLFGKNAERFPGRLSAEAEDALLWATWAFVKDHSRLEDADPERTWWLVGSENHDVMYKTTYLFGALVLSRDPRYADRQYDAGGTPAEHASAWTKFFDRYLSERGRKGLFIEVGSPTYAKYTLTGIYNLHDFAPDPRVRDKARKLLDLYWADWAEDQLDGLRGGGKSRVYQGSASIRGVQDGLLAYQYPYFGFGQPGSHMGSVFALTSSYRVPEVVLDLALDREGRGVYETVSRRPGDLGQDPTPEGVYSAEPAGRLLRYGYHTPDYVLGCCIIDPNVKYTAISGQNRWQGMLFRGSPDARVFTYLGSTRKDKPQTYDAFLAVQHQQVMLLRKNPNAHKYNRETYVYFANSLEERTERDGWVFARHGDAYVGCLIANGGCEWVDYPPMPGPSLKLKDERSVIVLHAGRKAEHGSFEAFQNKLLATEHTANKGAFTYPCPDGVALTMFTQEKRLPLINGKSANLTPDKLFDTPFIQSLWDSGVVTITKGARQLVLDFNQ